MSNSVIFIEEYKGQNIYFAQDGEYYLTEEIDSKLDGGLFRSIIDIRNAIDEYVDYQGVADPNLVESVEVEIPPLEEDYIYIEKYEGLIDIWWSPTRRVYYCFDKNNEKHVFTDLLRIKQFITLNKEMFGIELEPIDYDFSSVDKYQAEQLGDKIADMFNKIIGFWSSNIQSGPVKLVNNALEFVGVTLKGFTGDDEDYQKAIQLSNMLSEDVLNGLASLVFSRVIFGTKQKSIDPWTGKIDYKTIGGIQTDFGTQLAMFRTMNNMYYGLNNMLQAFQQEEYEQIDPTVIIKKPVIGQSGYWTYSKIMPNGRNGWLRSRFGNYSIRKNLN